MAIIITNIQGKDMTEEFGPEELAKKYAATSGFKPEEIESAVRFFAEERAELDETEVDYTGAVEEFQETAESSSIRFKRLVEETMEDRELKVIIGEENFRIYKKKESYYIHEMASEIISRRHESEINNLYLNSVGSIYMQYFLQDEEINERFSDPLKLQLLRVNYMRKLENIIFAITGIMVNLEL